MNCELVLERVAVAGWSPDDPDPTVEAHLKICPECRVRLPAADALGRRLRDSLLWEEPPSGLAESILEEATGATQPPRSFRGWWLLVAAVAALVVVFGASRYLARPDWTVELEGGAAAPAATAVVSGWVEGEDTRMVIEMTGLQDAPEGFFYEVWLTAPDGTHVSGGSFHSADRHEVTVAALRSDYPRIWITKEPADDDPGPAPDTVLDTTMADRASAEKPVANA